MNFFFIILVSIAVSILVIRIMTRYAPRLGLIDMPDERKVHSVPISCVGGIGIVLGALVPIIIWLPMSDGIVSYLLGSLVLFVLGVIDDAVELGHYKKFAGQVIAVLIVIFYGDVYVTRLPFFSGEIDPLFGIPFTLFAMIGVINAINHSDGLDGLAGGESLLSLLVIAYLAFVVKGYELVIVAVACIGGIIGFLRINTHPAQVFMGDSGSQFLGFTLGFLIISLVTDVHTALSPALPLLLFGLPVIDIVAVLIKRACGGMNWFRATRNHIHHRLLDLNFDHFESVITIYSIQALFVVSALLLRYQSDELITALYFTTCAVIFLLLRLGERTGWQKHRGHPVSGLTRFIVSVKEHRLFTLLPLSFVAAAIPLYFVAGSVWIDSVPRDFAVVSGVLFIIVTLEILFGKNASSMIMRGIAYTVSIFMVYLLAHGTLSSDNVTGIIYIIFFTCLAIAVAMVIHYESTIPFKTTTMDYLVIFVILLISLMPKALLIEHNLSVMVVQSVIILYGSEVLINRYTARFNIMNVSVALSLAVLSARGLLL